MTYENLNRLDALLASLPPIDFISHNQTLAEPLTNHRRGQRFKSSTAHHISGLNSLFLLLEIMFVSSASTAPRSNDSSSG